MPVHKTYELFRMARSSYPATSYCFVSACKKGCDRPRTSKFLEMRLTALLMQAEPLVLGLVLGSIIQNNLDMHAPVARVRTGTLDFEGVVD
jgi:hypothetical protein